MMGKFCIAVNAKRFCDLLCLYILWAPLLYGEGKKVGLWWAFSFLHTEYPPYSNPWKLRQWNGNCSCEIQCLASNLGLGFGNVSGISADVPSSRKKNAQIFWRLQINCPGSSFLGVGTAGAPVVWTTYMRTAALAKSWRPWRCTGPC